MNHQPQSQIRRTRIGVRLGFFAVGAFAVIATSCATGDSDSTAADSDAAAAVVIEGLPDFSGGQS